MGIYFQALFVFFLFLNGRELRADGKRTHLSYNRWCSEWGLFCPGLGEIFKASERYETFIKKPLPEFDFVLQVLDSKSTVYFEAVELREESFLLLAQAAGIGPFVGQIQRFFDKSGFQSLFLDNNQLTFEKDDSGLEVKGKTGLAWRFGRKVSLVSTEEDSLLFDGVELGAELVESQKLSRLDLRGPLSLSTNLIVVNGIPEDFFFIDWGERRANKIEGLDLSVIMRQSANFLSWLFPAHRRFHFSAEAFRSLYRVVRQRAGEPDGPLPPLIEAVETLETSNPNWMAGVKFNNRGIECRFRLPNLPPVKLVIDRFSSLDSAKMNHRGNSELQLSGVKAKVDIPGPADPQVEIKKIELTESEVVVQKIPIIGEMRVGYDVIFGLSKTLSPECWPR